MAEDAYEIGTMNHKEDANRITEFDLPVIEVVFARFRYISKL